MLSKREKLTIKSVFLTKFCKLQIPIEDGNFFDMVYKACVKQF